MEEDMENKDIPAEQKESRPSTTGDIPADQRESRPFPAKSSLIPIEDDGSIPTTGDIPLRRQESRPFPAKGYSNDTNPALIDVYLDALKQKESSGNYSVKHSPSVITDFETNKPINVQALGAYGILDINFPVWAKQAGLTDFDMKQGDWQDPKVQDFIAKFKVQEYFNTYNSWDLVSIAWFAGPEKAKRVMAGENDLDKTDNTGQSIKEYVAAMNNLIGDELMNIELPQTSFEIKQPGAAPVTTSMNPNETYAAQILDVITKANAGGSRPDFESQVPEQAGSFEASAIKTFIRRNES